MIQPTITSPAKTGPVIMPERTAPAGLFAQSFAAILSPGSDVADASSSVAATATPLSAIIAFATPSPGAATKPVPLSSTSTVAAPPPDQATAASPCDPAAGPLTPAALPGTADASGMMVADESGRQDPATPGKQLPTFPERHAKAASPVPAPAIPVPVSASPPSTRLPGARPLLVAAPIADLVLRAAGSPPDEPSLAPADDGDQEAVLQDPAAPTPDPQLFASAIAVPFEPVEPASAPRQTPTPPPLGTQTIDPPTLDRHLTGASAKGDPLAAGDTQARPPVPPVIDSAASLVPDTVRSGPAARIFADALHRITAHDRPGPAHLDPQLQAVPPPDAALAVTSPQQPPLDMGQRHWPAQMIARIEALRDAADAVDTSIRLVPDALGTIDVSLRRDAGGVHVHLAAEQAATRTLLTDAQPRLADLAAERGLKLAQTSVDGGSWGGATGGERQQPYRRPDQPHAPLRVASRFVVPDAELSDDLRIA